MFIFLFSYISRVLQNFAYQDCQRKSGTTTTLITQTLTSNRKHVKLVHVRQQVHREIQTDIEHVCTIKSLKSVKQTVIASLVRISLYFLDLLHIIILYTVKYQH